jgi:hypothetical protein
MKKQPRSDRRLALRPETVRELTRLDLAQAAGGDPTSTVKPTHALCTQLDC